MRKLGSRQAAYNKAKHNRTAKIRRAGLATLRSTRLCWRRYGVHF